MNCQTDEHIRMIEDCVKRESKMTDYERGFLDSIQHWLDRGIPLTARQIEILEKIWDKVT